MELNTAEAASKILTAIDIVERDIAKFKNTKEFCRIEIRGENGNETTFSFSVDSDKELKEIIRDAVNNKLEYRLSKLTCELNDL